ncbi:MAG: LLM class flavin-dependent oxidoreductase, partial [Rhodospirillales bacterium]|nr:LLM class flavin-dependent oxidoreductase [Rhodospirillales bacterium]
VVKTWTQPGPFRWEGTHYQQRVVNPWAVPLQKPYPRVWIPGVLSKETVIWTAQQRYPYIALNTSIEATKQIRATYDEAAAACGYTAGSENFGYLIRVHVQDTEEKALKNARQFMWMQGEFTGLAHPVWANPSGYFSPSGRRQFVEFAVGRAKNPRGNPTFEDQIASTMIVAGTPDQVIERLKYIISNTRPGIMGIWANDGNVSQEDRQTCIRLLFQEVAPAIKSYAAELGLKDPWEANAPVHLRYSTDLATPAAAAE